MSDKVCIATIKIMVKADSAVEACDGIGELLNGPSFVIDWGYLNVAEDLWCYPVMYSHDERQYEKGDFLEWPVPAPSHYAGEYEWSYGPEEPEEE